MIAQYANLFHDGPYISISSRSFHSSSGCNLLGVATSNTAQRERTCDKCETCDNEQCDRTIRAIEMHEHKSETLFAHMSSYMLIGRLLQIILLHYANCINRYDVCTYMNY